MIDSKPAGTNQPPSGAPAAVPATTRLGHVHLTVADLERELAFYQEVLGFRLRWREGRSAGLGAGAEDLLRLTELPGARPARNAAGLYHFAVLYPSRRELARAVARLFALRYPNSPTDHVVSKTTYLDDPEGQNIELYVRSPEDGEVVITPDGDISIRRYDGKPATGRDPVDVDALFEELTPNDRLDALLPRRARLPGGAGQHAVPHRRGRAGRGPAARDRVQHLARRGRAAAPGRRARAALLHGRAAGRGRARPRPGARAAGWPADRADAGGHPRARPVQARRRADRRALGRVPGQLTTRSPGPWLKRHRGRSVG
jgi:catechol 2,3-dioxygenase-like lactoylglutathione lyase family enzyme